MKRWIAIGVPILIVLALVGWRVNAEKSSAADLEKGQKARSGQSPAVEIAIAKSRPVLETLEVVGNVEAPYTVKLSPKLVGRIEYLEVREGDAVLPGQPLVRIDPTEIDAQVLQQQAAVSEARSRLAQAEMTSGANETRVSSAVRVEMAALNSAKAELLREQRNYDSEVSAAEAVVTDAEARVASARADVRQRQSELVAAQASEKNAKARLDRAESLLKKGFIAEQAVDDARERYATESANVGVAQNRVASAQSAVASAQAQQNASEKRLAVAKEEGKASIAAAKAKVEQARATYDEAIANRSQTPAYRENLRALRANVLAAEAGLRQFAARRQDTVLTSTIEGTVTERTADPGSLATPGQPILTIQHLRWVFVSANVPVENAGKVYKGQPVQIRLDAIPDKRYSGKIEQISQSADPQSRQFVIKVRLENAAMELRPGMFARLEIVTQTVKPPVVVPITAVKKKGDLYTVTVLDNEDKAVTREVKTGVSDRTGIAIEVGLKPGDRVVTLSYTPVRDGQKVRIGKPESERGSNERR